MKVKKIRPLKGLTKNESLKVINKVLRNLRIHIKLGAYNPYTCNILYFALLDVDEQIFTERVPNKNWSCKKNHRYLYCCFKTYMISTCKTKITYRGCFINYYFEDLEEANKERLNLLKFIIKELQKFPNENN
jgi:hypothetical protein